MNILLTFLIVFFYQLYLKADPQLDEIVVSASKLQDEKIIGSTVYIISKQDIQNYPSDTIPELIAKYPGIKLKDLYGTGFGVKQSIDIRGFGDTAQSNSVILLNGQRLTNIDLNLVDFSSIPKDSIDRIEIIIGNSSVLYGNNSSAGSINIITNQSIIDDDQVNAKISFGSLGKFENFFSASKNFKNFSIKGNQNQIFSDGFRRNNEYNQTNGSLEFAAKFSDFNYYLNMQNINQRIGLPGDVGVNTGNYSSSNGFHTDPRSTDTPHDFSQKNGYKIFYGFNHNLNNNEKFVLDGAFDYLKNEGIFISSSTHTNASIGNYQITPRFITKKDFFSFKNDIIFGLDFNYTDYYQTKQQPGKAYYRKYNAIDTSLGIYFNNNIELNQSERISVGARYQGNWIEIGDVTNNLAYSYYYSYGSTLGDNDEKIFKDPQFAYHLGYEKTINTRNLFTIKIGKSFRYPNVDERIGFGSVSSAHNFGLNSQNSYDFDISHKFFDDRISFQTTIYYMRLRNEIAYDNSTFLNRNLARTIRYGLENKFDYKLSNKVKFSNSFTLTQAKYRAGHRRNLDLTGVPAFKNNAEVQYYESKSLTLFGNIFYQSSHRMINDVENYQVIGMPYHTINAGIKGRVLDFDYSVEFNNILNKNYYNYAVASTSSYNVYNTYPKEGFNSFVTISKKF